MDQNKDWAKGTIVDRPCFCCGTTLKHHSPKFTNSPLQSSWHDSTTWKSIGNWCSTKLDCMMDPEYNVAQIVICDGCFEKNEHRILKVK